MACARRLVLSDAAHMIGRVKRAPFDGTHHRLRLTSALAHVDGADNGDYYDDHCYQHPGRVARACPTYSVRDYPLVGTFSFCTINLMSYDASRGAETLTVDFRPRLQIGTTSETFRSTSINSQKSFTQIYG